MCLRKLLLSLLLLPTVLRAQTPADPYEVDSAFGIQGVATFPQTAGIDPWGMKGIFVIAQADGRLLLLERPVLSFPTTQKLVRALPNGHADSSTGLNGVVGLSINDAFFSYTGIQEVSGGFVIGGTADYLGPTTQLRAMKLDNNLTLDPSFGTGGIASFGLGGTQVIADGMMAVQPDGKIVIGSSDIVNSATLKYQPGHGRLLPNGTLDPAYGTGGIVMASYTGNFTIPAGEPLDCRAMAMAMQPDGKTLTAGFAAGANSGGGYQQFIARYKDDGRPDSSFATNGFLLLPVSANDSISVILNLLVDKSGNIYLVFKRWVGHGVQKFSPAGVLQSSYGNGGKLRVIHNFTFRGFGYSALGLGIDAANNLYIGGSLDTGSAQHFALARYDSTGKPDTSFATGGLVEIPRNNADICNSLALQADGGVVLGGFSLTGSVPEPLMIRLKRRSAWPAAVSTPSASEEATSLRVYPNPSNGAFNCAINLSQSEAATISVWNALGQMILMQQVEGEKSTLLPLALPTATSAGMYFVRLQAHGRTLVKPLTLIR